MPLNPNPAPEEEEPEEIEEILNLVPEHWYTPEPTEPTPPEAPKRSRSSQSQSSQPKKKVSPAKSPKPGAAPPTQVATCGGSLDKVITEEYMRTHFMDKVQKIRFEELVWDDQRQYGQIRRIQPNLVMKYYTSLQEAKLPPRQPFADGLAWKKEGVYCANLPRLPGSHFRLGSSWVWFTRASGSFSQRDDL